MYFLTDKLSFPPVSLASEDGLLAIGGDLSVERILLAYQSGIFPWFEDGNPILWWSPKKRMVLFLEEFKVPKSMRSIINKNLFQVTFNKAFKAVISSCKKIRRSGQQGTWITKEMEDAYCKLHDLGHAKSIEVWYNNELVGGLYGVDLGHIFCGESMFSKVSNASKVAFIALVEYLKNESYKLLDCQIYNDHLSSLGARKIERDEFMKILNG